MPETEETFLGRKQPEVGGNDMAWYEEAVFYHIYPLGLCGAPKQNSYKDPEHRLRKLTPWIAHIKDIGCNAIYIGPLFESVGHGYETTDYRKLDSRLGTNEDLKAFVKECHSQEIRVIFDGVFNHTGRDFFAFRDLREHRENSRYKDWYCNVNFQGDNEYHDGFSYDNWGGYNLLVKLNQKNPEVVNYICDVVRFWVSEFDVDGIRLDAADVLDFDFMKALRAVANEVKPEFWLMGEVIHGDYNRWVNEGTLHSVTNYQLHKALYSGHNDHNYFEIAHTVRRLYAMGGNQPGGLRLYNFVDNHDVERIYTKLRNKAHFVPVHILLYTLPGIPSVYYGSEFGIEGKKERWSDDSLRPALDLEDYADALETNPCTALIAALGKARQRFQALSYGDYRELLLTNRQYAFSRDLEGQSVIVTVNNDDQAAELTLPAEHAAEYAGVLGGRKLLVRDGKISVSLDANSGEIWVPAEEEMFSGTAVLSSGEKDRILKSGGAAGGGQEPEKKHVSASERKPEESSAGKEESGEPDRSVIHTPPGPKASTRTICRTEDGKAAESGKQPKQKEAVSRPVNRTAEDRPYEEMTVEELQAAILEKMAGNGPVTEEMRRTVEENIWHNSLVNWVKSFR